MLIVNYFLVAVTTISSVVMKNKPYKTRNKKKSGIFFKPVQAQP